MHIISRREFIKEAAITTAVLISMNRLSFGKSSEEVFHLGVASADPTKTGAIIWTRVNPQAVKPGSSVVFEVSERPDFKGKLSGKILLDETVKRDDYTIKIDLDRKLKPGRTYYYRFLYRDIESVMGTFKTIPENTDRVAFGFVTCQNYPDGYYPAFNHLAEEDLDFVFHLGDFIYEKIYGEPKFRDRVLSLPSGEKVVQNIEDYRYLYRTYLSDKNLQLVRAVYPFIPVWDDHEFANDYYYDYENQTYRIEGHPFNGDKEKTLSLRKASIKAWTEYVPARVKLNLSSNNPLDWIKIYRDFKAGNLAHFILTDERSYRTKQPCDKKYATAGCDDRYRSKMLGDQQLEWFIGKLSEKDTAWKVWINEVQFSQEKVNGKYGSMDAWDGYAGERERVLNYLKRHSTNNLVVITGDRHAKLIASIPDSYNSPTSVVGVEYMTPAVSSINAKEAGWWKRNFPEFASLQELQQAEVSQNPWIREVSGEIWGYGVVELTPERADCKIYSVDKYNPSSPKTLDCHYSYNFKELIKIK